MKYKYNDLSNKSSRYADVADDIWVQIQHNSDFSDFDLASRDQLKKALTNMQDAVKAYFETCQKVSKDCYNKHKRETL